MTDPWDWNIYPHLGLMFMVNVGKYTWILWDNYIGTCLKFCVFLFVSVGLYIQLIINYICMLDIIELKLGGYV